MDEYITAVSREIVNGFYDWPDKPYYNVVAEITRKLKLVVNRFAWENELPIPYTAEETDGDARSSAD